MILIFEPNLPNLNFCTVKDGKFSAEKMDLTLGMQKSFSKILESSSEVKAIGYVLHNGGEKIIHSASILDSELLKIVKTIVSIQPENNEFTYKIADYWFSRLPNAQHVLLCETAFFAKMPSETSTYAIPYELTKKGIKRYGGHGLCHQWAWEQLKKLSTHNPKKVVSIYLGNHTDIAAIANGRAIDTSIGFTPVEGIPSSTGCGDIDPMIVFQLIHTGLLLNEVNRLLSRESGFSGLLGKKCGLSDIICDNYDNSKKQIKEIYMYSLIKYIGSFISILGGADSIIFSARRIDEFIPIVLETCHALDFLGVRCKINISTEQHSGVLKISTKDSSMEIFCLNYDKWKVMSDYIQL